MKTGSASASLNRTVAFLCYGDDRDHRAETTFAVLSAHLANKSTEPVRLVLYTDDISSFQGLPVETRMISAEELSSWAGLPAFPHRRKLKVLQDALDRWGGAVVFVDSDTWFRKDPALLFSRLHKGRSLLHMLEGDLQSSPYAPDRAFARFLDSASLFDRTGQLIQVSGKTAVWNSGVIGVTAADSDAVGDAIDLVDQIWPKFSGTLTVEQVAISLMLERSTNVEQAADIVFHYWSNRLRAQFRDRLHVELAQTANLPVHERAEALYRIRPRLRGLAALKHNVKEAYRKSGRQWPVGRRSSAT